MKMMRSHGATVTQPVDPALLGGHPPFALKTTRDTRPRPDGSAAAALRHMQQGIGEKPLIMENVPFFVQAIIRNMRGWFQEPGEMKRVDLPSGVQIIGSSGMAHSVVAHPTTVEFRPPPPRLALPYPYDPKVKVGRYYTRFDDAQPAERLQGLAHLRRAAVESCDTSSLRAGPEIYVPLFR
jgi:hypothetical protein